MGTEISDPNYEGLPDEAFEAPGEGGLTPEQLTVRIKAKREQAEQDAGWTVPPGMGEDVEPLPEAEVATEEEEGETPEPLEVPDEPEEDEPEEAEEPDEEPPEAEEDQFYAARYKTKEATEAGIAEKDRLLDMFFRREAERGQQPQAEEPQELDVNAWHEWAEEQVENGAGAQGALAAINGAGEFGRQAYNIYLQHWLADPEQQAAALAFNNEVWEVFAERRAEAAVAPLRQEMAQRAALTEASRAKEMVAARYPDFNDYQEEMDRLAKGNGVLPDDTRRYLSGLADQGVGGKARAWEHLYLIATHTQGARQTKRNNAVSKSRKASAEKAKIAATVSSAEAGGARTPPSEAESYAIKRKNEFRRRQGLPLIEE